MRFWNELTNGLYNPVRGSAARVESEANLDSATPNRAPARPIRGGPSLARKNSAGWRSLINILFPVAVAATVVACARSDASGRFSVREASVAGGMLSAQIDWQPSDILLDGLDHGIPLVFDITLSAQAPGRFGWETNLAQQRWRRELRYFPLTRQYQLRDPDHAQDGAQTRSYSVRQLVIAAITDLRLPLDPAIGAAPAQRYQLRMDLERDALPGALRLPALIDADWRLSTGNYAWPTASSAG